MFRITTLAVAVIAAHPVVHADIITVDDDLADLPTADFTSLQAAIDAAVTGDEIVVYPGTYEEDLKVDGKIITIRSTDPSDPLIVDATDIEPMGLNGILVGQTMPASSGVTFRGLKFSSVDANSFRTHAIFVYGGTSEFLMEDCVVFDYPDPDPSGILVTGGHVFIGADDATVRRCRFESNGRPGLDCGASNILIEDSEFSDSVFGGIFASNADDLTIRRCLFSRNGEGAEGSDRGQAAIFVRDSDGLLVSECVFEENLSRNTTDGGAALFLRCGASIARPTVIERSVFLANRSTYPALGAEDGATAGAILAEDSYLIIESCSFIGNEAVSRDTGNARGGAIRAQRFSGGPYEVRVVNSTFFDNGAIATGSGSGLGGAIFADANAAVVVENSIFRSNGPGGIFSGNVTINSSFTSGNPGFVEDPDGMGNGWTDDPDTATNEADNNDYGDLRLADGSPAINAGDNAQVISATDLDGDLRIRGGLVDQGAYESRFARYFVNGSRGSSGTGLSWNQAVKTLAELPIDGGEAEVRIAEGTYVVPAGGFELGTGAWIRGGYNANNGNQNPANNPVVLTGDINGDDLPGGVNRADNATRVLVADGAMDITIDGVTIRGANASGTGGGVRLVDVTDAQIIDTIIEDNDAGSGAGVYAFDSDVSIVDSIIRDNRGTSGAAGLRFQGASVGFISGAEISDNTTTDSGGGLSFRGGATGFIESTLIADNHADSGIGGVKVRDTGTHVELFNTQLLRNTADAGVSAIRFANSSSGILAQSVVAENSAPGGGTVRTRDTATLLIRQSTIAGNTTQNELSAGLFESESSTMNVLNTIVHGNTSAAASIQDAQLNGSGITLDYSLVEGWDGAFAGTGSVDGDPMFVDALNGDYRIGPGSDAIDAGDSITFVLLEDLDGNPRVLDDTGTVDTGIGGPPTIDIGAYEFQGTTPPMSCSPADLAEPFGTLTFGDISAFLGAFSAMDPAADLAAPFGTFTFGDISAFLAAFSAGCP